MNGTFQGEGGHLKGRSRASPRAAPRLLERDGSRGVMGNMQEAARGQSPRPVHQGEQALSGRKRIVNMTPLTDKYIQ